MPFRYIIYAPQSCTDLKELDNILKPGRVSEIYTPTEKSSIKLITAYCQEHGYSVKVFHIDWQGWGAMSYEQCFKEMIEYADAAIIFTDGESKNAYKLEMLCAAKPIPVRVVSYEGVVKERKREAKRVQAMHEAVDILPATVPFKPVCSMPAIASPLREKSSFHRELEQAEIEEKLTKKQKRKKYAVNLPEECITRYLQAHNIWFYNKFPRSAADHGYLPTETPIINDANSMQAFISKFLFWSGHRCTRLNVMGRKINGNYVVSSTRKGTADLSATINGKSCMFEIKFAKDTPSADQLKEQARERAAGGVYEFVRSIEDFFILYDKIVKI